MSTVEEIVIDIQKGENRKNELYAAIYKFLYMLCRRYITFAHRIGYEQDDLLSAAWFGVERAIKDFNPEKGYKFITYLKFHVNIAIHELLGIRNGKKVRRFISLDAPLPGTDDITLADTIEDSGAAEAFEKVEMSVYYLPLLDEVEKLPPIQRDTLKQHFLSNETLNGIAKSRGVSRESVRQHERAALRALRKSKKLRDCYYEDFAYRHIGVTAFNNSWTSSTEWAALKVMQEDEKVNTGQI